MNTRHIAAVTVLLAAAVVPVTNADIINVPGDQPTIQAAIDAAVNGDEVVVADGTYTGDGNRDLDFGGKAITLRSESGNRAACIIDCQGAGRFAVLFALDTVVVESLTIRNGDAAGGDGGAIWAQNASVALVDIELDGNQAGRGGGVFFSGGEVTISGCSFNANSATVGGGGGLRVLDGVRLICTDTSFTSNVAAVGGAGLLPNVVDPASSISGCQFTGNVALGGGGGGIGATHDFPEISDCVMLDNTALFGGGVALLGANTTQVENVVFLNNTATWGGGAEVEGAPTFVNCLFVGNRAINLVDRPAGGAVEVFEADATPTMVNCTFSGNSSEEFGGAITVSNENHLQLVNCVLWGNDAPIGPEIRIGWPDFESGVVTVSYCDVAGGEAGVSIAGVGTLNWGAGNINEDPLFVDPDNGDLRLSAGSRCIDRGDNSAVPEFVLRDLDGNPRFIDSTFVGTMATVDMGAYEYQRSVGRGPGMRDVLTLLGWSALPDFD